MAGDAAERVRELEERIRGLKEDLRAARREMEGEVVGEYALRTERGESVTLRELFGGKQDLLVVHNMGKRCVYCTMWADGFAGLAGHVNDRASFVLSSPDEPEVMGAFAASRGWPFRCVSVAGTAFARDMGFEPEPGKVWPGVSAFRLGDDGRVTRTGMARFGPGDDFCAAWAMFDLLEGGAGEWSPRFSYGVR